MKETSLSHNRLDRACCNLPWQLDFPDAFVMNGIMFKSDHRAVVVYLGNEASYVRGSRPFRFQAAWLSHDSFTSVVEESWHGNTDWLAGRHSFTEKITVWNKEVFGDIFRRKQTIIRRLIGIERTLDNYHRPDLEDLHSALWDEFNLILEQEEMFWFQKSRCDWLSFGDRNTKFFHASTIIRRKKNKIVMLKDNNGEWVSDQDTLKTMAMNFYAALFSQEPPIGEVMSLCATSNAFLTEDVIDIERPLCNEEIKEAMFSMGPFKAPGTDGFHAIFFQSQWDVVGSSVCNFVKKAFAEPDSIREVNQTILVLIPKCDNPENLKEMRPISLCNVIYKLITKVIANRLKKHLGKIILPHQCAFIRGRHSSDNIIISQEVIHSMRQMKGRKGFMAIKIDFEKAYDRLSWGFLHETLVSIGLNYWFVDLIMACVSTSDMKILWNGEMTSSFNPSRGVRQGDPLSPYLFVLCMERLSRLIFVEVENKN